MKQSGDEELLALVSARIADIQAVKEGMARLRAYNELLRSLEGVANEALAARSAAVAALRDEGLTYRAIAQQSGISEARIAQISRAVDKGSRAQRRS